ncbi:hypothetical protein PSTG_08639 [Puccinia striiformis f. sp. tritici PST-78]|uniref:Uncharacterized protein n=1 Tax=Puccinia striiformis f. sp. tritici PST-78 TaxID=1165861 RepID=A0A0L0VFA9_9BASI|nr:hypothetical protein PSTG_08639 [Puccinia striiformis f. sp. tritici PST-78]
MVTPRIFHEYLHKQVLPRFRLKPVSESTSLRWMYKIGFRPQKHSKSLYYDGHERADVVESRKKYLDDVARLRSYSVKYDGIDCDVPVLVDPEILGDNRETVFIYHDDSRASSYHSTTRQKLSTLDHKATLGGICNSCATKSQQKPCQSLLLYTLVARLYLSSTVQQLTNRMDRRPSESKT